MWFLDLFFSHRWEPERACVFTCLLRDVNYIRNEQTDRSDQSENNAGQHEPERDAKGD